MGAENQGIVAGDLVNTASRLQSSAEPGTVLVGEATFQAAGKAIAFERVGDLTLKGKEEPVAAWRALRVVGERGGANRSDAIEPPFVGRAEELRLIKELLRSTGNERKARLVSVSGIGGIGKSRLAWEFEKYADGLIEDLYWHRGRCPAYGDGVAFWALGEMVRMRAGIAETDDPGAAARTLTASVARWVGGSRGTTLDRAEARAPARAGGGAERRPRGALRRVAHVLRAHRGARHHGDGLRGPPVGRWRDARLHRVDARMVQEPADPDRDPGPARARRTATELGLRLAELQRVAPRAAPGRRDDRARHRAGARPPGRRHRPHRRPRRGRADVRGRDRADARGPGRAPGGDRPVRAARRGRRAGHPAHPARSDRRPAGRAGGGGPRLVAGRLGAGEELHAEGARSDLRPGARDAGASAPGARPGRSSSSSTPTRGRRNAACTRSLRR